MSQHVSQRAAELVERETQALALRRCGQSYEAIGGRLGLTTMGAWKLVQRAYERARHQNDQDAEFNRRLDLDRLDAALVALWPAIEQGDPLAVQRLLGVLERRAKLLGLDAPAQTNGQVTIRVLYDDEQPTYAEAAAAAAAAAAKVAE